MTDPVRLRPLISVPAPAPVEPFLVIGHARALSRGSEHFRASRAEAARVSWQRLFEPFVSDAHVVQYAEREQADLPARISALTLPSLAHGLAGLCSEMVCIDLDNPGHRPWEDQDEMDEQWEELVASTGCMEHPPSAAYLTRAGARLVWRLSRPVELSVMLGIQAVMAQAVAAEGYAPDAACLGQWTRMFRLPYVRRDGIDTVTQPYGDPAYCFCDGPALDPRKLKVAATAPLTGTSVGQVVASPLPDVVTSRSLVYKDPADPTRGGRTKLGALLAKAAYETKGVRPDLSMDTDRHRLLGLVSSAGPIRKGRNDTIMHAASWLCHMAVSRGMDLKGMTPEAIWGFLEPVLAATDAATAPPEDTDRGASSWTEFGWFWIEQRWHGDMELELQRRALQAQEEAATEELRMDDLHSLARRIEQTWPQLPDEFTEDPADWVQRHIVLTDGGRHGGYALNPRTLSYEERKWGSLGLRQQLEGMGWAQYVPLYVQNAQGTAVKMQQPMVLEAYASNYVMEISAYSQTGLAWFDGRCMRLAASYPNPMVRPEFSAEVDAFLNELVGEREAPKLKFMLSRFSAVDRYKLATIVLQGASEVGKSMLAQGLAKLFVGPRGTRCEMIPMADIASNANGKVLESPIVLLDESSADTHDQKSKALTMEVLKNMVSGNPIRARKLYGNAGEVAVNYRSLILSNDKSTASMVLSGGGVSTTLEVVESHRRRTVVFETLPRTHILTPSHTEGWVDDLVIANHVAYLATKPDPYWMQMGIRIEDQNDRDIINVPTAYGDMLVAQITGRPHEGTHDDDDSNTLWNTSVEPDLEWIIRAMDVVAHKASGGTACFLVGHPKGSGAPNALYTHILPIIEAMRGMDCPEPAITRMRRHGGAIKRHFSQQHIRIYAMSDGLDTDKPVRKYRVCGLSELKEAAEEMGSVQRLAGLLDSV